MDDAEREAVEEEFAHGRGLAAELVRRRLAGEQVTINPLSDDLLHLIGGLIGLVNELGMQHLGAAFLPWLNGVEQAGAEADVVLEARAILAGGES